MGTSGGPQVAVKAIKALNKRPIQSRLKGTEEFTLQRRSGTKDVFFFSFLNLSEIFGVFSVASLPPLQSNVSPAEELHVHIPVMFAVVS